MSAMGGMGGVGPVPACSPLVDLPTQNDIADCKREAVMAARRCDETGRICLHQFYEGLCESERADVITAAYRCQDPTCRTFSDPNEADVCLRQLHEDASTDRTRMLDARTCERCPSSFGTRLGRSGGR